MKVSERDALAISYAILQARIDRVKEDCGEVVKRRGKKRRTSEQVQVPPAPASAGIFSLIPSHLNVARTSTVLRVCVLQQQPRSYLRQSDGKRGG